jgi:hypothetical protein
MFRKNVTFQLAMILLVVIVSYALNVRGQCAHTPGVVIDHSHGTPSPNPLATKTLPFPV